MSKLISLFEPEPEPVSLTMVVPVSITMAMSVSLAMAVYVPALCLRCSFVLHVLIYMSICDVFVNVCSHCMIVWKKTRATMQK